jgi:uncharacterized membrane protein
MNRWLWKAAETFVAAGLVVFILVPFSLEKSFVTDLYQNQPVFCVGLLTGVAGFVIATSVQGARERRNRKHAKKTDHAEGASCRGTL